MKQLVFAAVFVVALSAPASAGLPDAIEAYDQGDYESAFAEAMPAARRGDADAQYLLGHLYARGEGTEPSLVRAYLWYTLAARQGDEYAAGALVELGRRMSREQVAEAEALASGWTPATD
jgi:TPR repeat protein